MRFHGEELIYICSIKYNYLFIDKLYFLFISILVNNSTVDLLILSAWVESL